MKKVIKEFIKSQPKESIIRNINSIPKQYLISKQQCIKVIEELFGVPFKFEIGKNYEKEYHFFVENDENQSYVDSDTGCEYYCGCHSDSLIVFECGIEFHNGEGKCSDHGHPRPLTFKEMKIVEKLIPILFEKEGE